MSEQVHNEDCRYGSASWASEADLRRAGMFDGRGDRIGYFNGKSLTLETDAPRITIAGAGSGKARDLLVEAIAFNACKRNFILDPRGELYATTIINFAEAGAYAPWLESDAHAWKSLHACKSARHSGYGRAAFLPPIANSLLKD